MYYSSIRALAQKVRVRQTAQMRYQREKLARDWSKFMRERQAIKYEHIRELDSLTKISIMHANDYYG